jgi:hypothetical protein
MSRPACAASALGYVGGGERPAAVALAVDDVLGFVDSILKNVRQDDSNNEVTGQAAASNSTIFWMALSAR